MFKLSLNFDTLRTTSPVAAGDSRIMYAMSVVMTATVVPAAIWMMPWVQARLPTVLRDHRMMPGAHLHLVGGIGLRWMEAIAPRADPPMTEIANITLFQVLVGCGQEWLQLNVVARMVAVMEGCDEAALPLAVGWVVGWWQAWITVVKHACGHRWVRCILVVVTDGGGHGWLW
ncbi:hypothetical protein JB92DRAFT_2824659 [Gautieria morchelliformis]|nr:hypothetical protein JB92DRAFT_2824659 [Gautieria morchelliformis]